jgi:sulfite reductase (ferredoxin)
MYNIAQATKKVFHDHGNRRNKHHSRIRFLIHEDLGVEKFRKLYRQELDKIYKDDSLKLQILPIDNAENLQRDIELEPLTENIEGFEAWDERKVSPQKQQGLNSVKLPLNLGDLDSRDCVLRQGYRQSGMCSRYL